MSDEATSIAVALRRHRVAQAGRTPGGDGERGTDLAGRVRAAGDHGTPQSTRGRRRRGGVGRRVGAVEPRSQASRGPPASDRDPSTHHSEADALVSLQPCHHVVRVRDGRHGAVARRWRPTPRRRGGDRGLAGARGTTGSATCWQERSSVPRSVPSCIGSRTGRSEAMPDRPIDVFPARGCDGIHCRPPLASGREPESRRSPPGRERRHRRWRQTPKAAVSSSE